jgi:hypothetical protein
MTSRQLGKLEYAIVALGVLRQTSAMGWVLFGGNDLTACFDSVVRSKLGILNLSNCQCPASTQGLYHVVGKKKN